jgi:hypothetical protein
LEYRHILPAPGQCSIDPGRAFKGSGQGPFLLPVFDFGQGRGISCFSQLFSDLTGDGFSMAQEIVRPFKRKLSPEHLGHEVIDSDHMEISNCWYLAVNCGPLQFPFLIARMKKLMQKHFAREAEIMKRFDRPLPACHQTEHELLLQFCDNAARFIVGRRHNNCCDVIFPDTFVNTSYAWTSWSFCTSTPMENSESAE